MNSRLSGQSCFSPLELLAESFESRRFGEQPLLEDSSIELYPRAQAVIRFVNKTNFRLGVFTTANPGHAEALPRRVWFSESELPTVTLFSLANATMIILIMRLLWSQ